MSLDPKNTAKMPKSLPEQGLQPARCFAIIDLGTQTGTFKGQPKEPAPELMICWELTKFMTTYKKEDGPVPATVMQKYTFSNGKKAKLPKVLKSWGKLTKPIEELRVKPYLGKYCMLNIVHSEDGEYANISDGGAGVNPYMIEIPKPAAHYKDVYFDLDNFSWEIFDSLPAYPKKLIQASKEWPAILKKNPAPVNQGNTDNIDGFSAEETDPNEPAF